MPYVSTRISDGLGNRFFQVAAMLGYSEKYGHTPVFANEWILTTNHSTSYKIQYYFPELMFVENTRECTILEEPHGACYTYITIPRVDNNVHLRGYFQSEKYFPSIGVKKPQLLQGLESRYTNYAFLHVRRGDYLLDVCKHHYVNLSNYYRYALSYFADSDTRILVCSDDIIWCKNNLVKQYGDLISEDRWEFLDGDTNEYSTLRSMVACGRGGICANSTFSWWGAWLNNNKNKIVIAPREWFKNNRERRLNA